MEEAPCPRASTLRDVAVLPSRSGYRFRLIGGAFPPNALAAEMDEEEESRRGGAALSQSRGTGTDQVADPLGARFPSDPEAELPGRSPAPARVPFRVPICTKLGTTQSN